MLTAEQRKERAEAAIARAMATLEDVRAAIGTKPLAKGAGDAEGTLAAGIARTVSEAVAQAVARTFGDAELHDMAKAAGGVSDDMVRAREVAAEITGERDPAKLDAIIEAALSTSVYDTDGALPLAKAGTASPISSLAVRGLAAERAHERLEQVEFLAKNAGGVTPDELRTLRSTADVLAYLRDNPLTPMPIGPARPREDRRAALRREIEEAKAEGVHPTIIKQMENELEFEFVKATTTRPAATITARGAIPLAV